MQLYKQKIMLAVTKDTRASKRTVFFAMFAKRLKVVVETSNNKQIKPYTVYLQYKSPQPPAHHL